MKQFDYKLEISFETIYIVFLSRSHRLIVARWKFDALKTNICPRIKASRANMLVLRTSNFQGTTIRLIVRDINTLLFLLFTTKFSSMH